MREGIGGVVIVSEKLDVVVASIKKDIQYLTKSIEDGFTGVYKRQDLANGKLLRHEAGLSKVETELSSIESKFVSKVEYEQREGAAALDAVNKVSATKGKVIWLISGSVVTIVLSVIGTLVSKIFFGV